MREENQSSKLAKLKANLQKTMKKRWVLPALYLGLAALVLSTVIWLQGSDEQITQEDPNVEQGPTGTDQGTNTEDALPVTTMNEVFKKPFLNEEEVQVVGYYFDFNATAEQNESALVFYDNTFYQNKGMDFALESGETFDVVAALSGTVVKVEKDALFGNLVHIEHENNVVTIYQSLEGVKVEQGQSVKQGDVIGQAGRNLYNQEAGVHVHFEIRHDGVPVNPSDFFEQPLSALPAASSEKTEGDEVEEPTDEELEENAEEPLEETDDL
ncbi:M23 family metallopeptidase [Anaerobacillus sp. CMMVII]|uniref:M23 family metallopeptidase n=1 Tax=Anaerobacillus sp. CMMVII TaxID=2755588 RepID=UPI0021B7961A|nr:M23 family metallopeptidase [Anaerobacillus sp. CMMVII]MCT8140127.1 M23 family metallopeptidase [Anaerobacillus sp. CMMVII]